MLWSFAWFYTPLMACRVRCVCLCLSTAPRTQKKKQNLPDCLCASNIIRMIMAVESIVWTAKVISKTSIIMQSSITPFSARFQYTSEKIMRINIQQWATEWGKKPFLTKYKWINTKRETFGWCTWYLHLFQFFSFTLWNDGTGMNEIKKIRKNLLAYWIPYDIGPFTRWRKQISECAKHPSIHPADRERTVFRSL